MNESGERLRLAIIFSSTLASVMGVSLVSPVLAELRSVFGVTDVGTSLFLAVYTLPGVFLVSVVGVASDRVGRRRVLGPLLFLYGFGGVGVAFTSVFRVALALRFLQGVGASGLITLAITLIGDHYRERRARRLIGINSGLIAFGAGIFPILGGALGSVDWRLPFFAFGSALFVGLGTLVSLEEPQADTHRSLRSHLAEITESIQDRIVLHLYGVAFVTFVALYGGILTVLPFLLRDRFGFGPQAIGTFLAITALSNAATAWKRGWLGERLSPTTSIELGTIGIGLALAGLSVVGSPAIIGAMLALFGGSVGLTMPTVDSVLTGIAPAELRASMMAGKSTLVWLGQTCGPVLFTGVATTAFGPAPASYLRLFPVIGMGIVCYGILHPLLVEGGVTDV